jgi:copper transport protein
VRRFVVLVAVVAGALGGLMAAAPTASAHAALKESDPANGALLDESPSEIRLTFTEPPDLSLTTIGVLDRFGAPVPTGPVDRVPGDNHAIRVALQGLSDGVYTVTWRTVSATDGHLTSGAFSFGVGVSAAEVAPVASGTEARSPSPTAAGVAGRWALYVGLALLFGCAVAGLLAFGPRALVQPRLLAAAWGLGAAGVIAMTLDERATVGVPLGTLLESDSGGALVRLAIAVGVVGLATLAASLRPGTGTFVLLAATAGAAMAVRAFGGHAGASAVEGTLQTLHFAAVGAWVGGLAWLVVGVRRGTTPERVRRYSTIAASGLGVLVVTGLLRASNELGGATWWLHAFETSYGTALVVKLAIVAGLVALGAVNRYRNVRRYEELGRAPLLRTVGGELFLAAGVLAVTGVLTGLAPQGAATVPAPPGPRPLVVNGSDFATTTRVRLRISPGTLGANAFEGVITDYDTGDAVDARRVSLFFSLPDHPEVDSTLELERGQDGTWRAAGTALALDGTWDVTVLIEGSGGSVEVPLQVTPESPEQNIEVSHAQGQPDIYTISLEDGVSIQAYVDPGIPGRPSQVHVTAFDADGSELPVRDPVLQITQPDGSTVTPQLLQLSPGHFVANVEVQTGTSTFHMTMQTDDGRELVASFDQTFGA